jgi:hypothetical protein
MPAAIPGSDAGRFCQAQRTGATRAAVFAGASGQRPRPAQEARAFAGG